MLAFVKPLPPEMLRRICDPATLPFETTAEVTPTRELIGQPRAARALEFGMGLKSKGYNIFATGEAGTGRSPAIRDFLQARCGTEAVPDDWVYVYNFDTPHRPLPLPLPAGQGKAFQEVMKHLVDGMKLSLLQVLESYSYRQIVRELEEGFDKQRLTLLEPLERKATEQGFRLEEIPSGLIVKPISGNDNHNNNSEDAASEPSPEEQQHQRELQRALQVELQESLRQLRRLERETLERRKDNDREAIDAALSDDFEAARAQYTDQTPILDYLDQVRENLLEQVSGSAVAIEEEGLEEVIDLRRYEVNLFVDNSATEGAPVIVEVNPTYENLFGRFEHETQGMVITTHFTRMKPGALHLANGGYLILESGNFDGKGDTWDSFLQALRSNEIELRAPRSEGPMVATSIWPEPVPLNVKVILLGNSYLYYKLSSSDSDERSLFKVRADFSETMVRDAEHEQAYAAFIARRCQEEELRPFASSAVAKIIEFGSRLADDQEKLSAQFGIIADVVREADYMAGKSGQDIVTADHVVQAIEGRIEREAGDSKSDQEDILRGMLYISTEGCIVGQVNGLVVAHYDEFSFGHPTRITARTYLGEDGVINIERENDMSGPTHSKGVLTLSAYLGGTYAQHQPLSLSASLTIEQYYHRVHGDSASSTELYALLSSLSDIPLKQSIAVTGSVNQHGEIQPIGGVNGKIEGFFDICRARGLTGEQGVMIPVSNVRDLMLREDVIQAVADGQFSIWPVKTIDEGIELLTDVPAGDPDADGNYPEGTIHHAVMKRLREMALELKSFGEESDDDSNKED
ncbi:MAG: ATP-binding protein [Chloroflexota bacterium]